MKVNLIFDRVCGFFFEPDERQCDRPWKRAVRVLLFVPFFLAGFVVDSWLRLVCWPFYYVWTGRNLFDKPEPREES